MAELGPGIPETLKHYRLVRRLGSGGMGAVFEAIDRRVDTRVAIKILHSHLATDESFRERFEREAHVAALLRSPYTVHITDFGFDQGLYFLVMEYVEGQSVAQRISAEGRIEPRRAVAIAADAARALEEAAARGVVHRDIKPDNILLGDDGSVKVADFGVARREGGGGDLTSAGGFIGTSAYAAPEQATDNVDARADIYALGGTLYCMLTGQPPFSGTAAELLRQHQDAPLPMAPLAGLPDQLINIVRRCMEKEREDRYQDASALAGALERALRSLTNPGARTNPGTIPPATVATPAAASAATVVQGPASAAPVPLHSAADAGMTLVSPSERGPGAAEGPETVVSGMATPAGGGSGDGKTPFATPPPGGGGKNRRMLIVAGAIGAIVVVAIGAALALGGGGDDGGNNAADDDSSTPTSREETRTARTREAREETREARTQQADDTPTVRATATPTLPPPTAIRTAPPVTTTSGGTGSRIVAGDWTYNFVTVSNTCGGDPKVGDAFDNTFAMEDANNDGFVENGEAVDIIDGQNGAYLGTYTFTYPSFTWEADLEDGDFVVLRNQYIGDSTGSSLREDHYTVNGRPCVIAFQD